MKKFFNYLIEDKLLQRLFIISIVLLILTVIYVVINYSKLPPLLPVFNQLPWGEQRLASTSGILIPSLIAFLILAFNVFFSSLIYKKAPLISRMLAVTSLLIAILAFLFIIRTVQIVV